MSIAVDDGHTESQHLSLQGELLKNCMHAWTKWTTA